MSSKCCLIGMLLVLATLSLGLGGCVNNGTYTQGPYASAQEYAQPSTYYSGRKRCPDCAGYRTDGNAE